MDLLKYGHGFCSQVTLITQISCLYVTCDAEIGIIHVARCEFASTGIFALAVYLIVLRQKLTLHLV